MYFVLVLLYTVRGLLLKYIEASALYLVVVFIFSRYSLNFLVEELKNPGRYLHIIMINNDYSITILEWVAMVCYVMFLVMSLFSHTNCDIMYEILKQDAF